MQFGSFARIEHVITKCWLNGQPGEWLLPSSVFTLSSSLSTSSTSFSHVPWLRRIVKWILEWAKFASPAITNKFAQWQSTLITSRHDPIRRLVKIYTRGLWNITLTDFFSEASVKVRPTDGFWRVVAQKGGIAQGFVGVRKVGLSLCSPKTVKIASYSYSHSSGRL